MSQKRILDSRRCLCKMATGLVAPVLFKSTAPHNTDQYALHFLQTAIPIGLWASLALFGRLQSQPGCERTSQISQVSELGVGLLRDTVDGKPTSSFDLASAEDG